MVFQKVKKIGKDSENFECVQSDQSITFIKQKQSYE